MIIRRGNRQDVRPSEITPEATFHKRGTIIKALGVGAAFAAAGGITLANARELLTADASVSAPAWLQAKLQGIQPGGPSTTEDPTPWEFVTGYN